MQLPSRLYVVPSFFSGNLGGFYYLLDIILTFVCRLLKNAKASQVWLTLLRLLSHYIHTATSRFASIGRSITPYLFPDSTCDSKGYIYTSTNRDIDISLTIGRLVKYSQKTDFNSPHFDISQNLLTEILDTWVLVTRHNTNHSLRAAKRTNTIPLQPSVKSTNNHG